MKAMFSPSWEANCDELGNWDYQFCISGALPTISLYNYGALYQLYELIKYWKVEEGLYACWHANKLGDAIYSITRLRIRARRLTWIKSIRACLMVVFFVSIQADPKSLAGISFSLFVPIQCIDLSTITVVGINMSHCCAVGTMTWLEPMTSIFLLWSRLVVTSSLIDEERWNPPPGKRGNGPTNAGVHSRASSCLAL